MLALHREKFHLVETFVVSDNNCILCISETFIDSFVDNIQDELNISGYNLVQCDHPFNTKRGCVSIYYNDCLLVIRGNGIFALNESIILETCLANNKCFLTRLYRSPSQKMDQFDESCSNRYFLVQ